MVQTRGPRAKATRLSEVVAEDVVWLWRNRIPIGKLTLFSGNPGIGKSFVSIDMAARVTTGAAWPDLPGESREPGNVIVVSCEDGLGDTVKPRLLAAGGDPSKVIALESVCEDGRDGEVIERGFRLDTDIPILEQLLIDNPDTRLVLIDPISGFCGKVDQYRDAEVRAMLAPLSALAAKYGVAVVMVGHMAKAKGGNALTQPMGSIAFVAAARAQLGFFKDRDDPMRRLILLGKLNLAKESDGLAYRLIDGRVVWESEPVTMTADEYLQEEVSKPGKTAGVDTAHNRARAEKLIRESLEFGPIEAAVVLAVADSENISAETMGRVRRSIGSETLKVGGVWKWFPPGRTQADESPSTVVPELLTP